MATEIMPVLWLGVAGYWDDGKDRRAVQTLLRVADITSIEDMCGTVRLRYAGEGPDFIVTDRDFEWFEAGFTKYRVWHEEETDGD